MLCGSRAVSEVSQANIQLCKAAHFLTRIYSSPSSPSLRGKTHYNKNKLSGSAAVDSPLSSNTPVVNVRHRARVREEDPK